MTGRDVDEPCESRHPQIRDNRIKTIPSVAMFQTRDRTKKMSAAEKATYAT
jgi:hypothetical protein